MKIIGAFILIGLFGLAASADAACYPHRYNPVGTYPGYHPSSVYRRAVIPRQPYYYWEPGHYSPYGNYTQTRGHIQRASQRANIQRAQTNGYVQQAERGGHVQRAVRYPVYSAPAFYWYP